MPYDDAQWTAKLEKGPLFCSIAAFNITAAQASGTKVKTSAATNDRIAFLSNVKITAAKVITRSGAAATGHALSLFTPSAKILHGTETLAYGDLGTAAGVTTNLTLSSTLTDLQLTSTDTLVMAYKADCVSAGTHAIGTLVAQSYDLFIEYQRRFT